MQLSKGFDYAIRSLVYLSKMPKGESSELKAIADSCGIPVSYLAKVMRNLVRGGLVTSTLGRDGGYVLRKQPGDISLLMVYKTIEGELRLIECMDDESGCSLSNSCRQIGVWKRLKDAVEGVLLETNLGDLVGEPEVPDAKEEKNAGTGA